MDEKTWEAAELLSRCNETQMRMAFAYILLLSYMAQQSNPEAERINAEYQAEIAAGSLTEEKHNDYLAALTEALRVW